MTDTAAPLVMIVGVIAYAIAVVFFIFPALDRKDATQQVVYDAQAKECRQRGGIPIMSAWDGRLTKCEGVLTK